MCVKICIFIYHPSSFTHTQKYVRCKWDRAYADTSGKLHYFPFRACRQQHKKYVISILRHPSGYGMRVKKNHTRSHEVENWSPSVWKKAKNKSKSEQETLVFLLLNLVVVIRLYIKGGG